MISEKSALRRLQAEFPEADEVVARHVDLAQAMGLGVRIGERREAVLLEDKASFRGAVAELRTLLKD